MTRKTGRIPAEYSITEAKGEKKALQEKVIRDFPGGVVVKNPPANAGDTGSSPGPGRFHVPRSS